MTDSAPQRRIALLVDAENMQPEYMRSVLLHVFKLGRPVIQYAFGDFSHPCAKPWVEFLRRNVIEARQVTPAESGKNAADIALVVEAMRLALQKRVDALCIVSSDRDFVALTTFLKGEGIDVYGFGDDRAGDKYRQSCAGFFEVRPDAAMVPLPGSAPTPAPAPAPTPAATGAANWPAIMQHMARLAGKEGWLSLQVLGCELGKQGIRAKAHGAATWARVFACAEGFEVRKDTTGRASVRITARACAA